MNARNNQPRVSTPARPPRPARAHRTPGALLGTISAIFIAGPVLLLTSQLSLRAAIFMITGIVPGLLYPLVILVPPWLFPSPDSHAYYFFGQTLKNDPAFWIPLILSALCTVATLGMPACAFRSVFKAVKN
jgi:hypothetical protein